MNLGTLLGEIGHDLGANNPRAAGYENGHGDAPCHLKNGESVSTRTRRGRSKVAAFVGFLAMWFQMLRFVRKASGSHKPPEMAA